MASPDCHHAAVTNHDSSWSRRREPKLPASDSGVLGGSFPSADSPQRNFGLTPKVYAHSKIDLSRNATARLRAKFKRPF